MKISVQCPESVRQNKSLLSALSGAAVSVEGALLAFDFQDEPPHALIRKWDEELGLAIADADEAAVIAALSHLKATVGEVSRHVQRESSYTVAQQESVAEATDDSVISHSHDEQNTSTDNSSERHGVAPLNEENVNVEAPEEEQDRPRRRRAAGRE